MGDASDGATRTRRRPPVSLVERVAAQDAALADVDDVARQWAPAVRTAEEWNQRLAVALRAAHDVGVPDPQLVDVINRHVKRGERAFGRPMRAAIMSVRRRMGLAPGKTWADEPAEKRPN